MGSDNLFHKRKAKAEEDLGRKKAKKSAYEKVLIVCEGEKTEPNYFNEVVKFHRINSANVAIDGTCGSSPKSVFERAVELYEIEEGKGDSFDRVYCVFDKDAHETYEETLNRILLKQPKSTFYAVTSVPCFEYWLLLHFCYTTKPYVSVGASSIAEEVLKDIKAFIPEYKKEKEGLFIFLYNQLSFAKNNAIRALKQARDNNTDNPSTFIHELVTYLQTIKD